MSSQCPLARSERLVIEELDGELLVYDSESNLAHALEAEAAALWRACDGRTDPETLAVRSSASEEDVRKTVARLTELGLLEAQQDEQQGDTRRDALRKITLAGAGLAAVPTISSIIVPAAAQAASAPIVTEYPVRSGSRPTGIMAGSDGALYFTQSQYDGIGRMTTLGQFTEYTDPSGQVANQITAGPNGRLYYTYDAYDRIGVMTTSGQFTQYTIPSGGVANEIAAGPDGALWFTETQYDRIGRITTSGAVTEYPTTSGSRPSGITSGPDGALWFTETQYDHIGRITPP
jgi:hypothetical protein